MQYLLFNGAQQTTAAPVKQPTGNAIRTMMQVEPKLGVPMRIVEWGCSFDASAAATPGQVELFETTVAATMSTANVAADVTQYDAEAILSNSTASFFTFGATTNTGFATAAVTEGTVANARNLAGPQMIAPTNQFVEQFPLGYRPFTGANVAASQTYVRMRVTFGTTVNMYGYLILEA